MHWNSHESPPFQYCNHVSVFSVQLGLNRNLQFTGSDRQQATESCVLRQPCSACWQTLSWTLCSCWRSGTIYSGKQTVCLQLSICWRHHQCSCLTNDTHMAYSTWCTRYKVLCGHIGYPNTYIFNQSGSTYEFSKVDVRSQ